MNPSGNSTATSLAIALLSLCAGWAHAETGKVINLSGPLLSMAADGKQRVLSPTSAIVVGETLLTGDRTYTRVKFSDDSMLTLRPGTQAKLETYVFASAEDASGKMVISLLTGALRLTAGLIGKHGGQDAYQFQTPAGTISTRGATVVVEYVPGDAPGAATAAAAADPARSTFARLAHPLPLLALAEGSITDIPIAYFSALAMAPLQLAQNTSNVNKPGTGGLAAGLYVHVIDGVVNLTNRGGSQSFSAGQFGYTPSIIKPPVVVPVNPGIQFSPPPAFSSSTAPQGNSSASGTKPKTVDCEVR